METKAQYRRFFRQQRKNLLPAVRKQAEQRINRLLKGYLKGNARLGVYWPMGSELHLDALVVAARCRGCRLYLPYIELNSRRLWFTPYRQNMQPERHKRAMKTQIPQFGGQKIRAHQLQAILVPLVGVDQAGYRLGQGGGYYDTSLAATRGRLQPRKIGVGFACQQVERLPADPHDIRVDDWVCETGIQRFKKAFK